MIDLSIVNKFVSIATSNTIGADARISIAKDATGRASDVRTTETTAFSRLKERTFRSNEDAAINRSARQELVNVLTGLFRVNNVNHLPPSVRAAFVQGEIVCNSPLTRRRVSAIMTEAVSQLGFRNMAEFDKCMKMKAYLDNFFGRGSAVPEPETKNASHALIDRAIENHGVLTGADLNRAAESEYEDPFAFNDDEMHSELLDHLDELEKNEKEGNPEGGETFASLGFTKQELTDYYNVWRADIFAATEQRATELESAVRDQSPALNKLESIYGDVREAVRVVNRTNALLSILRIIPDSNRQNKLQGQIYDAVNSALLCVVRGNPKDSAVKKAAAFLRGVKIPPECTIDGMIRTITYEGVADGYKKTMAAVKKNVDTFVRRKAKETTDKAHLKQLDLAKANMFALLRKLNPMGNDMQALSESLKHVDKLYDCACRLSGAEFALVDSNTTLDGLIEMIDNRTVRLDNDINV